MNPTTHTDPGTDSSQGARPHVIVVGGGAAGLLAAIGAARQGAAVTILEGSRRVGQKILATGNGRCNLSNRAVSPQAFNRPDFVQPLLDGYGCGAVLELFAEMGLETYSDEEGRVYPTSNAANSVLNVLRLEATRLGIVERCEAKVVSLGFRESAPQVTAFLSTRERVEGNAVVVATGGGTDLLETVGHSLQPFAPVLCPIRTDTDPIRGLSGLRVRCSASIQVPTESGRAEASTRNLATETGELLFRDYGVSGVMVFDLSRYLEPGCVLSVNFLPDYSRAELEDYLAERASRLGWRTAETFLEGLLHPRLAQVIVRELGVSREAMAGDLPIGSLADLLHAFTLRVDGPGDPEQAQVIRGGATVTEFRPDTLQSLHQPALFAAGEALDIDGRCGGYNLHWAWASGYRAGQAAVEYLR